MNELILGTAQFGAGYGITNATGRIGDQAMAAILRAAAEEGIGLFDTAADYGDSQARLGAAAGSAARKYVTKFSLASAPERPTTGTLFENSARSLNVERLEGVLFHRVSDLEDARCAEAVDQVREARADGRLLHAGVSIYDDDDLQLALAAFPDLDLLQIPGNVVDRRLLESPTVAALRRDGVEIHVRSALLQGLLLASAESLPPFFAPLAPVLESLARIALAHETSVLAVLLGFLRNNPIVDGVVFGATTEAEIREVASAWNEAVEVPADFGVGLLDEILDPRRWPAVKVLS